MDYKIKNLNQRLQMYKKTVTIPLGAVSVSQYHYKNIILSLNKQI